MLTLFWSMHSLFLRSLRVVLVWTTHAHTTAGREEQQHVSWCSCWCYILGKNQVECFTITHVVLGWVVHHLLSTDILPPKSHEMNCASIVYVGRWCQYWMLHWILVELLRDLRWCKTLNQLSHILQSHCGLWMYPYADCKLAFLSHPGLFCILLIMWYTAECNTCTGTTRHNCYSVSELGSYLNSSTYTLQHSVFQAGITIFTVPNLLNNFKLRSSLTTLCAVRSFWITNSMILSVVL